MATLSFNKSKRMMFLYSTFAKDFLSVPLDSENLYSETSTGLIVPRSAPKVPTLSLFCLVYGLVNWSSTSFLSLKLDFSAVLKS